VLITGANRGIGAALAQAAMAAGHVVTGTYRESAPNLPGAEWRQLEVTDPASQARLGRDLVTGVDLLICNAGVFTEEAGLLDTAPWVQGFAVNVMGVYLTIEALLPRLNAGAKIAIIASNMGSSTRAPGESLIYRASKAAAINLGRNLAADLRPKGLAVGIFHPGWVRTDMGGAEAEIDAGTAADGLLARFDALSLASSGVWEDWQGQALTF
jgi:NAD(P)-dependent dehydrogenase (short-subunit alcohol dehydrogenase family)